MSIRLFGTITVACPLKRCRTHTTYHSQEMASTAYRLLSTAGSTSASTTSSTAEMKGQTGHSSTANWATATGVANSTGAVPADLTVQFSQWIASRRISEPSTQWRQSRMCLRRPTRTIDDFNALLGSHELDFRVRSTLKYARDNLSADLSLSQLARINGISSWHCCRLFAAGLGQSPARCIKLLRLAAAADLLVDSTLSVKEIGAAVGINNQSHFVRDFREVFGLSPRQYRIQQHVSCSQPAA